MLISLCYIIIILTSIQYSLTKKPRCGMAGGDCHQVVGIWPIPVCPAVLPVDSGDISNAASDGETTPRRCRFLRKGDFNFPHIHLSGDRFSADIVIRKCGAIYSMSTTQIRKMRVPRAYRRSN